MNSTKAMTVTVVNTSPVFVPKADDDPPPEPNAPESPPPRPRCTSTTSTRNTDNSSNKTMRNMIMGIEFPLRRSAFGRRGRRDDAGKFVHLQRRPAHQCAIHVRLAH